MSKRKWAKIESERAAKATVRKRARWAQYAKSLNDPTLPGLIRLKPVPLSVRLTWKRLEHDQP